MTFGEKLQKIRMLLVERIGTPPLSQNELAKKIGLTSGTTISGWEKDKNSRPVKQIYLDRIITVAKEYKIHLARDELTSEKIIPRVLKRKRILVRRKTYTPQAFTKVVKTLWDLRWKVGERIGGKNYCLYQCELAEIIGIHPTTVSNYHCKRRIPHPYVRRRLIDFALKYSIFICNEDFVEYDYTYSYERMARFDQN